MSKIKQEKLERNGIILNELPSLVQDEDTTISSIAKILAKNYSSLIKTSKEELSIMEEKIINFISSNKQKVRVSLEEVVELIRR